MAHSIGEMPLPESDGHAREVVEESDMNPPKLSLLQTEMKVMAHAAADAQREAPGDVMNKVSNILLEDALELKQLLHPQGSSADENSLTEQDSPEAAFDATRREIARFLSEDQRRLKDGVVTKKDPTELLAVHKLTGGLAAASRADTDPAPAPAADPAPTSAPTSKVTKKSLKDFYGEVTPVVGSVIWVCIFLAATCCCMVCCWGLLGSVLFGSQAKEDGQVDDELDGLHEVWVRSKGQSSRRSGAADLPAYN